MAPTEVGTATTELSTTVEAKLLSAAEVVPAVDGLSGADGAAVVDELVAVWIEPLADAVPAVDPVPGVLLGRDGLVGDDVVPVRSAGDNVLEAAGKGDAGAVAFAVPMTAASTDTLTMASIAANVQPARRAPEGRFTAITPPRPMSPARRDTQYPARPRSIAVGSISR